MNANTVSNVPDWADDVDIIKYDFISECSDKGDVCIFVGTDALTGNLKTISIPKQFCTGADFDPKQQCWILVTKDNNGNTVELVYHGIKSQNNAQPVTVLAQSFEFCDFGNNCDKGDKCLGKQHGVVTHALKPGSQLCAKCKFGPSARHVKYFTPKEEDAIPGLNLVYTSKPEEVMCRNTLCCSKRDCPWLHVNAIDDGFCPLEDKSKRVFCSNFAAGTCSYAPQKHRYSLSETQKMSNPILLTDLPQKKQKVKKCRNYPNCPKGDLCNYLHPDSVNKVDESKLRTRPCKFFAADGSCKNGDKCTYSHDFEVKVVRTFKGKVPTPVSKSTKSTVCRFYAKSGSCKLGDKCEFPHVEK